MFRSDFHLTLDLCKPGFAPSLSSNEYILEINLCIYNVYNTKVADRAYQTGNEWMTNQGRYTAKLMNRWKADEQS